MATESLKINRYAADLSGSATPLEYKHTHSLAHFDSRFHKDRKRMFCWRGKIFYMVLDQLCSLYNIHLNLSLNDFRLLKKVNGNGNKPLTHLI